MATTNPTPAERTTRVHQLADDGLSNRAIARQLGIHHTTVGRILRTPTAPAAPVEDTAPAPVEQTERTTPATSENPRAPRLLYPLDPRTIQDLNVLTNPHTGRLPAALLRTIHAAAEHRRASMRTTAHRYAAEQ